MVVATMRRTAMAIAAAAREPNLRLSYARAHLAELERMRQV